MHVSLHQCRCKKRPCSGDRWHQISPKKIWKNQDTPWISCFFLFFGWFGGLLWFGFRIRDPPMKRIGKLVWEGPQTTGPNHIPNSSISLFFNGIFSGTACADDSPLDYNTCDGCCRCYVSCLSSEWSGHQLTGSGGNFGDLNWEKDRCLLIAWFSGRIYGTWTVKADEKPLKSWYGNGTSTFSSRK